MESTENNLIRTFDERFTSNKIQMMKILFSRLPSSFQKDFAVYIKFMELQYTMNLSRSPSHFSSYSSKSLSFSLFSGDHADTLELLDELIPFSTPEEQKRIENIKNMLRQMSQIQNIIEMMQMMQELFPEGFGGDSQNPSDILSGLSGMFGSSESTGMPNLSDMPDLSAFGNMDLSALFQMFGNQN